MPVLKKLITQLHITFWPNLALWQYEITISSVGKFLLSRTSKSDDLKPSKRFLKIMLKVGFSIDIFDLICEHSSGFLLDQNHKQFLI